MNALRSNLVWAVVVASLSVLSAVPSAAHGGHSSLAAGPLAGPAAGPVSTLASVGPTPSRTASAPSPSLAHQVLDRVKASGVPLRDVFLPNLDGGAYVKGGVVHPVGTVAPAPMGLGDFGVRNTTGHAVPYVLQSTSWEGSLSLNSVDSFLIDTGSPDTFTVQLNTVTTNTTVWGNTSGSYWIQNVFDYQPSTATLTFLDNIWNFSSPTYSEPASTFYSYNGTPVAPTFYYDVGPILTVPMPFTIHLYVNTSTTVNLTSLFAYPTVRFGYNILNDTGGSVRHGVYDTVLFNARAHIAQVPLTKFMVNGAKLTPTKFLLYDSELMIGGPGGGTTATIYGINGSEQLRFLNSSTGRFQNDPSAWNIGTDTGETSEGIAESYTHAGTALLSGGPSIPVPLWNATPGGNLGQASIVGKIAPSNGFLFVSPGRTFNESAAAWAPVGLPADAGAASGAPYVLPGSIAGAFNYSLPPGNYSIVALMSNYDPWNTTVRTTAGTNTVRVALTRDPSIGVYTPLYAWDNAQLANISSSGSGTPSDPYVLFNNQYGDLSPLFGEINDYVYAAFPGIMLADTNASVRIDHAATFQLTYPASYDGRLARNGLPTTNHLQIEVYESSNVVLWNAPAISGWFFNQDYGPAGGLPLANVVFWDVTNSLIAGSTFNSQGSSLVLMNGPGSGGGNVVWGNTFKNAAQTPGMLNNGSSAAIYAFESGDLIYNNYVATPVPAVALPFSEWNGAPQPNAENWNLSGIEPASARMVVDGLTLSGSVVGSAWQCGNAWANFRPQDPTPYTDGGLIFVGGDYCPYPINPATYPITFEETGLAGGYWAVTLENMTGSAAAGAPIGFALPAGTWTYSVPSVPGYTVLQPSGTVTLAGSGVTVTVAFAGPPPPPPHYTARFTETGLAFGSWSVSLANTTQSAVAGAAIDFSVLSGSYPYEVLPVPGFTATPASGTDAFNPGKLPAPGFPDVPIAFSVPPPPPTHYPVTFTEGGLSTGTAWTATLNGVTQSSFGSSISFYELNGSFAYKVGSVADYASAVTSGTVTVAGLAVLVAVPFTPLNGHLSGTVSVAGATLTANGNALNATNGAFNVSLAPGTYTLVATASGYAPYYETVSVAPGQTTRLAIALTPVPSNQPALSSAQSDGIIGAVIFLAVAILVAGLLAGRGRTRGGPPASPPPAPWTEPPPAPKTP